MSQPAQAPSLDSRHQYLLALAMLAAAALAWLWTLSHRTMALGIPAFVAAWTVMMAAMMLPSLVPSVLLFQAASRSRAPFGYRPAPSPVFVAGYFAAWALLGATVAVAGDLAGPVPPSWQRGVVGSALIVAGAYQLTRLKAWCLGHCRSPMHFFMAHWKDGPFGALRLGAHHGLYCVGCCWGLMVAFIALGMMRPACMGLIALVILLEKTAPSGQRLAPLIGMGFILAGALVALNVLPTPDAMMGGMHGEAR
jgi:predicted metal-binding membrane protein